MKPDPKVEETFLYLAQELTNRGAVAEFKSKLASGNHFLTAVLKGQKVFLLGDEDELRKMVGARLAKAGADQPQ
jgi:hypothetical protein